MHNPYPRFSFGFRFNLMDDASQNVSFDVVSVAIIRKSIGVDGYTSNDTIRQIQFKTCMTNVFQLCRFGYRVRNPNGFC